MGTDGFSLTFIALFLPFIAAVAAPFLTQRMGHKAAWVLALVPAFLFLHFATYVGAVASGGIVTGGHAWIPSLGVDFSWLLDGLSLTFALLISGIGTFIVLYSGGYLKGHAHQGRFFSFMLMFMGAMQGLVISDSFLMFFVFWELTSITSFLLIGFDHAREASRRAAMQALIVTGMGGLALLAGLLVIWSATGATSLSGLLETDTMLRESALYGLAFVLILGGAFTKSAQFPFHFWLPNAMEAPTPVSAYLHSATMVKAGVYLLMRLNPVMGDTALWETVLPLFGGVTLLVGGFLAVRQSDLKLMLAYTTVASLGLLVMLTGFGSEHAIEAAVLYLIAHSLFKGALFMVAGIIDHEAGSRDVTRLGGLRKAMPITFGAALVAAISMGGLPPLFGFLAKEEIYYALGFGSVWSALFTLVAILGNALMFAIGFAVALKPFLGPKVQTPNHAHEGPPLLWLGPVVLAGASLLAALLSPLTHRLFSMPMARAVAGEPLEIDISLIPSIGVPLLLSLVTVALGYVIYRMLGDVRERVAATLAAIGWGPDKGFDQAVRGIVRGAHGATGLIQNGRMETYMTLTFAVIAAAFLVPLVWAGEMPSFPQMPVLTLYEIVVIAIAVIGLGAVLFADDRLTAIVSLGIQGFAVALIFLLFGAPDLGFTQFMVETLSVVILALVITRLKLAKSDHRPTREKLVDVTVAVLCGLGLMLALLKVTELTFDPALSVFFTEYSRVIAHGRNIVNVILVDYRGVDTMGEIAVVMAAGLAILALVRVRLGRRVVHDDTPARTKETAA
ncbi:MAG: putative monovalent cation/H+ antiporter subunit A [Rhizobiaceae bacterium]|nr:putative monovalent cation/H+ antiporter subunit A [Rhizobiaceae bacterium]